MKKTPDGWVRVVGPFELIPAEVERMKALAASDELIDTSDIPELDDDFFKRATRGRPVRVKRPRVEPAE